VAPLIFDPHSPLVHPRTFPYLHFAAYYQAHKGGDLGHSFARAWNVPVRYRSGYPRHVLDGRVEFNPRLFSFERDLPHYDYLLVRRRSEVVFPPALGLEVVAREGPWTLIGNPRAESRAPNGLNPP
jgi:hypothetical protein